MRPQKFTLNTLITNRRVRAAHRRDDYVRQFIARKRMWDRRVLFNV